MPVLVKIDAKAGQQVGDWVVALGSGRTISRHRQKDTAIKRARREGRKRNMQVRVQNLQGQWRQLTGQLG